MAPADETDQNPRKSTDNPMEEPASASEMRTDETNTLMPGLDRLLEAAPEEMVAEELDWAVGAVIDDVHRLLTRIFDRRMARIGLTRAQWRVLTFLFRRDGMTQSALADLLEMERAPLGRLLDRLEESGWVERRSDPDDKRAKRVFRTTKIDPLLPTLKADAHEVLSGAMKGLTGTARRDVVASLAQVKGNLQAMERDAPDNPPAGGQADTPGGSGTASDPGGERFGHGS